MVIDDPGLPVLTSSDATFSDDGHFEALHHRVAPLCDTVPIGDPADFTMDVVDYLVDDVIVSRMRFGPQMLRRTPAHVATGETDRVAVMLQHRGTLRGEAGRGNAIDMRPARVGYLNLAEPFTAVFDHQESTWISVPRNRIEHPGSLQPAATIDSSGERDRISRAAVTGLWSSVGRARADDANELAGAIVETINTILDPDEFTPTDRDVGLAMRDFLGANLSDLDIGADSLRVTFHRSRATVFRLFEPYGGVASYLRAQRLMRCFDELSRPAKLPRRISEVATRWGFDNPSHFHRLFKARYGLGPSDVAGASRVEVETRRPAAAQQRIQGFREWAPTPRG